MKEKTRLVVLGILLALCGIMLAGELAAKALLGKEVCTCEMARNRECLP